jgi:hypothetical protein
MRLTTVQQSQPLPRDARLRLPAVTTGALLAGVMAGVFAVDRLTDVPGMEEVVSASESVWDSGWVRELALVTAMRLALVVWAQTQARVRQEMNRTWRTNHMRSTRR